ncbi:hypothetical protein [Helicobacter pylori]|uniref:hypothetical protein n=1 Tax=Helicobacter pylori TaxID=210 RepID=UPI00165B8FD0|nr:hypothetical protein [Helicobacter pylori]
MSLQTLKNKAFRVSVQWNALVRKPLSLERGGFTDKDKQEENQTMHEFLKSIQHEDKDHSLTRQIARAGECRSFMKESGEKAGISSEAMLIVEFLIVELLKNGGFDD